MEIIVDAYGPEEQAMGWYYYLEENLQFPYTAMCKVRRAISPLLIKDEVSGWHLKKSVKKRYSLLFDGRKTAWLASLTKQAFIGTKSRLLTLFGVDTGCPHHSPQG